MSTTRLSRRTKAVIAGVAGGALLLGTGATFAVWSDSAGLSGATITTGRLSLDAVGFAWEYQNAGDAADDWTDIGDGSQYLMIPGQTVRGTFSIDGEFEGTDLTATLTATGTATEVSNIPGSVVTWTLDGTQTGAFVMEDSGIAVTVDDGLANEWVVTIHLPDPGTVDNSANNAFAPAGTTYRWNLSGLTFTLTQDTLT